MKTVQIQITQEGYDNLVKERDDLTNIDRLQKARAMGDLRENSEYSASKEEQGLIEGRVAELEQLIANAEIVQASGSVSTVQIGVQVDVESNGKKDTYYIVGEYEADPMNKKLSQSSPIGKALMGKKVGETVDVDVPVGKMSFRIVDIK